MSVATSAATAAIIIADGDNQFHPFPPPSPPSLIRASKWKAHIASACVNCKKAHLSCDSARPCARCVASGKQVRSHYSLGPTRLGAPRAKQWSNVYGQRIHVTMYNTRNEAVLDYEIMMDNTSYRHVQPNKLRQYARRLTARSIAPRQVSCGPA